MARALAARPEIIFGDEPTGNLDSRAGAEVLGFLRRSVDDLGQTIVMVTHDPVAASYADRVLYLADGRIVDEMTSPTADQVLDRMKDFDAPRADVMTVLKTSMRNFFAHKGRMALSAVAVLLSVAFVCGTLVFTDTMNTTFDKLFAVHRVRRHGQRRRPRRSTTAPQNGRPASVPAAALAEARRADGVKSAEGASAENVTVVDSDNKNIGSDHRRPDHREQLGRRTRPRSMEITSGHVPARPDRGDGRRRHRREAPPEDRRQLRVIAVTGDFTATHHRHRHLQGHQPRRRRRLLRHRHRPARAARRHRPVYTSST